MRNGENTWGIFMIPEPLLTVITKHYAALHCESYCKSRVMTRMPMAYVSGIAKFPYSTTLEMPSDSEIITARIDLISDAAQKINWKLIHRMDEHPSDFSFIDNNGDEISIFPGKFPFADNVTITYG